MKKPILAALAAVFMLCAVLVGVVLYRALTFGAPQPAVVALESLDFSIDTAAVRLGEAIRFRTVSLAGAEGDDPAQFEHFHRWMQSSYPAFHATARREAIGYSLLYTWEGANPALAPIILLAHQDVVPVPGDTVASWSVDPFGGSLRDGAVWGRGALDDKGSLIALLEAAEYLAAQGRRPARTILFAFGHDEEIGGESGARRIAELLAARGVRAWFALDEGGGVIDRHPLTGAAVAMIGVSERGFGAMRVRATGPAGHSSLPPAETTVSTLALAITRIHRMPLERSLEGGPAMDMMRALGSELPLPARAAIANEWLFGPLIQQQMASSPPGRALVGTSIAPTMLQAGVRANVLPAEATAIINFRIHPRDNADTLLARARAEVADLEGVTVEWSGEPRNADPISSSSSSGYALIAGLSRALSPEAPVAPMLVLGGTDSRHYRAVAEDVYRFAPVVAGLDEGRRAHGVDERLTVENLNRMIRFYIAIMQTGEHP
ncbi:MAG: M20/M25/M40 family metallo-hydrolase [Hyphomonadaceae bacterium]|nr:M20/M25/M40 family metallo-hydrolase [Hyphomonadaceae bacterium]